LFELRQTTSHFSIGFLFFFFVLRAQGFWVRIDIDVTIAACYCSRKLRRP
jgi:hypothetical protein